MKNILLKKFGRREFLKASIYGVALSALPQISLAQSNPDVVVIGAGSAGLAATAELLKNNKSVICIEAMNRIGGRCHTDNSIFGVPYDTGAHWLHNLHSQWNDNYYNQIAQYGKDNDFKIYDDYYEDDIIYDGRKIIYNQKKIWDLYSKIKKIKSKAKEDRPFIDFIPNNLKQDKWFDTVAKIITTRDFDNFSPYDGNKNWQSGGDGDGFVKGGYGALLAHYRKGVPVKLNTIATKINWSGKGVKVETNNGTIDAKACIVTVSTGVLNSSKIKFTPELPAKKYEAFDGISMNSYHRIAIEHDPKFFSLYGINADNYLYMKVDSENSNSEPEAVNGLLRVFGKNVSYFNTKGRFAKDLENEGQDASIDFVLNKLRSTLGSSIDKYFIKAHATEWINNPYTLGAYSGAKPGKANLRNTLKEPVGKKIFFAGEATAGQYATVHGADRSGKRAAELLIKKVKF